MNPIFASHRYRLVSIIASGKKQTPGRLVFVGKPSIYGSEHEVISPVSGIVVESRFEPDSTSRAHRLGPFVTVAAENGVVIRFSGLAIRIAKKGDMIAEGQVIGIAGDKGVAVDCLRNGRLVNAVDVLDVPKGVYEFEPEEVTDEEKVAYVCGIGDGMREHINRRPDAAQFWRRVADAIEGVRE